MIQAAIANVVRPAVAAKNPHGLLDQHIVIVYHKLVQRVGFAAAAAAFVHRLFVGHAQFVGRGLGSIPVVHCGKPFGGGFFQAPRGGRIHVGQFFDDFGQLSPALFYRQLHTHPIFGVVLKQRVRPSRALPLAVGGVGHRRRGTAPNGGTARGVGNIHTVTKQLGNQLGVRRFAATRASAGELQQGLFKLAALDGFYIHRVLFMRQGNGIVPVGDFVFLAFQRFHDQRFFLGRAFQHAHAAAVAIHRRKLYTILVRVHAFARAFQRGKAVGRVFLFFLRQQERAESGVGAYIRAAVALYAVFGNPARHVHGYAAFFVGRRALRESTVLAPREGGNRQVVAFLRVDGAGHLNEVGQLGDVRVFRPVLRVGPAGRHLKSVNLLYARVNGGVVHANDFFAAAAICFLNGGLHIFNRVVNRQDVG